MPMSKPICRVRAREWINRIPPSAERNERAHSNDFGERPQTGPFEGNSDLPSLPDLLEELESEAVDLSSLEQLTQTLLEDIARDLESAAQKAADQESTSGKEDVSRKVVGTAPEQLESSGTELLEKEVSVEQDISEYLLLHHNYAKSQPKDSTSWRNRPISTRKLKNICPKISISTKSKLSDKRGLFVQSNKYKVEEHFSNNEMAFGTFDGSANTITLLVNNDSVPLNEVIVDDNVIALSENNILLNIDNPNVADANNSLTVHSVCDRSSSPRSDLGYDSVDSPLSNSDLEKWDQSVSELFPSLL